MIFTRQFVFARLKALQRESDVVPAEQVHHLHLHLPRRKGSEDKQHAA